MGFNSGVAAEEREMAKLFIMARRGAVGEVGVAGGLAGAGALKRCCNCSLSCCSSVMILSSSFSDCRMSDSLTSCASFMNSFQSLNSNFMCFLRISGRFSYTTPMRAPSMSLA